MPITYLRRTMNDKKIIRYVALGDSYTICEGATREESWPCLLVKNLRNTGVPIELIANPSVTGWTTQDLINKELPVFDASSPTFATLLIGVNDWVQGVSAENFYKNLNFIIDHVQGNRKKNTSEHNTNCQLILITIPDFSVTPDGPKYSKGRNIAEGITEFNNIMRAEAEKRNLKCVDIFPISQQMLGKPELVSSDNLHPSAKEYAIWETLIFPVAHDILKLHI